MRYDVYDDEGLAAAIDSVEVERSETRRGKGSRANHLRAMRALERKRELEELRAQLSDFDDYLDEEE